MQQPDWAAHPCSLDVGGVFQKLVASSDAQGAAADWTIAAELAAVLASAALRPAAEALAQAAGHGDRGAAHSLASQLEASAQMLHLATTAGTAEELGPSPLSCFARQLGDAAWHCYNSVRLHQQAIPGNSPPDGRLELQQSIHLLPAMPAMVRLLPAAVNEPGSFADSSSGTASTAGVSALSPTATAAGSATASASSHAASLANALRACCTTSNWRCFAQTPTAAAGAAGGAEAAKTVAAHPAWRHGARQAVLPCERCPRSVQRCSRRQVWRQPCSASWLTRFACSPTMRSSLC